MDFNRGSSTINGLTFEAVALELTNKLDILEKLSKFNYVTVDPDPEGEQCGFTLNLPITSFFGNGTAIVADQYVADPSFATTGSSLSSSDLINALCELWGIIAVAIKKGQQLAAFDCNIQINPDITGKALSITVTDFPCSFTVSGSTLVIQAKTFLEGSHSITL